MEHDFGFLFEQPILSTLKFTNGLQLVNVNGHIQKPITFNIASQFFNSA